MKYTYYSIALEVSCLGTKTTAGIILCNAGFNVLHKFENTQNKQTKKKKGGQWAVTPIKYGKAADLPSVHLDLK